MSSKPIAIYSLVLFGVDLEELDVVPVLDNIIFKIVVRFLCYVAGHLEGGPGSEVSKPFADAHPFTSSSDSLRDARWLPMHISTPLPLGILQWQEVLGLAQAEGRQVGGGGCHLWHCSIT